MMPGKQLCTHCGGILTFRDEYQRWFCYTCHRSLGLLPKKSKRAIALGIVVLIVWCVIPSAVLYVWVTSMTPTTGGVYAISTSVWTDTGTTITTSVISTTPTSGIKIGDIIWQLQNVTSGAVTSPTPTFTSVAGATLTTNDYLTAGCSIAVTQSGTGSYKIKAIVGGSQVYESAAFNVT